MDVHQELHISLQQQHVVWRNCRLRSHTARSPGPVSRRFSGDTENKERVKDARVDLPSWYQRDIKARVALSADSRLLLQVWRCRETSLQKKSPPCSIVPAAFDGLRLDWLRISEWLEQLLEEDDCAGYGNGRFEGNFWKRAPKISAICEQMAQFALRLQVRGGDLAAGWSSGDEGRETHSGASRKDSEQRMSESLD